MGKEGLCLSVPEEASETGASKDQERKTESLRG